MTRDQFIMGEVFVVSNSVTYKGANTYKFNDGVIVKQSRSSITGEVLLTGYHLTVTNIGEDGFEGFVYVMSKLVKVKYKFKDLKGIVELIK